MIGNEFLIAAHCISLSFVSGVWQWRAMTLQSSLLIKIASWYSALLLPWGKVPLLFHSKGDFAESALGCPLWNVFGNANNLFLLTELFLMIDWSVCWRLFSSVFWQLRTLKAILIRVQCEHAGRRYLRIHTYPPSCFVYNKKVEVIFLYSALLYDKLATSCTEMSGIVQYAIALEKRDFCWYKHDTHN